MPVSDQLTKVSARAKQAEDRACAANDKAASELRDEVEMARESSQEHADKLRLRAESQSDAIGVWWGETQRAWNEHLEAAHRNADGKVRVIDLRLAQRNAHDAELNAAFAIDYAYAAIEEAEFAALDAARARAEADEMASPRSLR
jgi:hypothetical protein